ncbi:prefoldin subunit alpha [Methanobacterium sp. CWC-01]|uniref:prefoldin subunit alpha n=1 Tax=Methanobacterium aridiramus TaxID=2584467 RepID=UPI002576174B|nr:prefoldin subunit alpha [Methanobacterium sp. CWC-01]WJI09950.1 prefoldin subunit alpha [Methanobacterium sp. CWC-01]
MEDRQRLEELINELNMYKAQADLLNQQIETLKVSISELAIAMETLDELKGKEGVETFVPIGAGSFLITEIKNTEEIIVGVGAGAAIKKKVGDAQESIKNQKEELEGLLNRMMGDLRNITEIIVQKSPEAEELLQQLEGTPG